MKKTRKIIAILLTMLTLMSVVSAATPVLATEVTEITEAESDANEIFEFAEGEDNEVAEEQAASDEPEILNEMVEWRTESTKYFRNSDGSYTAAQYAYPVHYKENSEWKEIDNTLREEAITISATDSEKAFVAKNTNTPASFPESLSEDGSNEISVTADGHKISFSPKKTQKEIKESKGKVKDREDLDSVKIADIATEKQDVSAFKLKPNTEKSDKKAHEKNEKFKIENKSGAIVYENVYDNVDLEYELNNSKLKESIVLNEKQNEYVFSFDMDLGGLYPVICEDGSINLCSDNSGETPVAKIEAPYMVDSNGEYSDAVTMTIEQYENKFVLTVNADKKWLNDEKRVFPVVIDPTIVLDVGRAKTYDCYIDNSQPNTAFPYDYYIYAGNNTLGKTRTFIKFDLPDLPDECSIITNATINFWQKSADIGNGGVGYLNLYNVTSDWDNDYSVTWNKHPSYNKTVLDYCEIDTSGSCRYRFDITKSVKGWYNGESNYGLMLMSWDESKTKRAQIYSAENTGVSAYPVIQITYRNNKGIEDYWSYTTVSAGTAGTAYINDYTGNLVFGLPVASIYSERSPVNITAYFNTYCAGEKVGTGTGSKYKELRTTIGKGFRLNYQQTVLPSTEYGLTGDNAKNYPYVYTDGDGTEHYIRKVIKDNKTTYEDEDGLGLTLTTATSGYTYKLTTKLDTQYLFNSKGNLFRIIDSNGNQTNISFCDADPAIGLEEKERISKITDGVGHKYIFEYYPDGSHYKDYVKSISDNANRKIIFDIAEGKLNKIYYYKNNSQDNNYTTTYIDYCGNTPGLINYVCDNDGYAINFDYNGAKNGYQVTMLKEYGDFDVADESGTYGQKMSFNRAKYNQTIIRSYGQNDVLDDDDDVIKTYQFDDFGRLVSQKVKIADGSQSVASNASYVSQTNEENKNIKAANSISSSSSLGKNVVNHIKNPNAESTTNWTKVSTNATGTTAADSNVKYYGEKSIKVTNGSLTNTDGRTYIKQEISNLKGGKTYTLSGYVKVSSFQHYNSSNQGYVALRIKSLTGNDNIYDSVKLTGATDGAINHGFMHLRVSVTLPSDATGVRIYAGFWGASGTAYFDGFQLEYGSQVNPVNFLENSGFEFESDGMPTSWTELNLSSSSDGVSTAKNFSGSHSMKITGNVGEDKRLYQNVKVDGNQNDTYILSGWATANAVKDTHHCIIDDKNTETTEDDEVTGYTTKFEILATVYFKDSSGNEVETPLHYSAKFNQTISSWQFTSTAFSLQYPDHANYVPYKIRIMPRYNHQANIAYFDSIQLIKDVAQSYIYDSEGNMTTVSANAEQKNNMKYDGEDNLTEYKDALGNKTEFKYQENTHNLTQTTSPKGIKTTYTYDEDGHGLLRGTLVSNSSNKRQIQTGQAYTSADSESGVAEGAYIKRTTDQHQYQTLYSYHMPTGAQTNITDANGNVTSYSYDEDYNKLKTIIAEDSQVSYNYDGNRLTRIIFGDESDTTNKRFETYSFTYDRYGNNKATKVGEQTLSTNTYGPRNGSLEKITYGNGDIVSYEYDKYGNNTKITKGNNVFAWAYNSSGVNTSHKDTSQKHQYIYSYDSIGRLIRQDIYNTSNGNYIGATEFKYDTRNNLTKLAVNMGGNTVTQSYKYSAIDGISESEDAAKENLPTRYNITSTRYVDYDYDSLNRLDSKTFQLATNHTLVTDYAYYPSKRNADGSVTYQTDQLKSEVIDNQGYLYYYDKVGNITRIQTATGTSLSNPTDYKTFVYDELNQLESETVAGVGKTVYTYDELGNILKKEFYGYGEDGKLSSTADEIVYTYSTGVVDGVKSWNYLLTGVDLDSNGTTDSATESISYDKIGNPTKYLGADLEWFGRQLNSYTKTDLDVDYTYAANGLRSTKTVNGVKSEYLYLDGQLVYEKRGNVGYYYFYDAKGHFAGLKWFDEQGEPHAYYALTNSMGDVLGLYTNTGVKVVEYSYDTWGVPTIVYDKSDFSLGTINPIRYRGYYYDTETKLYYLQSRYYNPEVGRFLNGDGYLTTGQGVLSYNMFAYCNNNPVMYSDSSGNLPEWAKKALNFIVGKVISIMTKSKNPKIKLCGDTLNAAKKGFEKGQKIMSIENPLTAPTAIKEQYVNDIDNVGKNDATVTKTPDPIIFPDVNEYNVRCQDMWDDLSTSPVYSDLSGGYFDKTEAQNTIICWDYETCFDLCDQTILTTFTETMVDIMEVLYG